MNELTNSVYRAGKVLEALFEDDFQGKTVLEIVGKTGLGFLTVRRCLLTWRALGWVVETPVAGSKSVRWAISEKLAEVAFQYRRHALGQIHEIEKTYLKVSGEELPR